MPHCLLTKVNFELPPFISRIPAKAYSYDADDETEGYKRKRTPDDFPDE